MYQWREGGRGGKGILCVLCVAPFNQVCQLEFDKTVNCSMYPQPVRSQGGSLDCVGR